MWSNLHLLTFIVHFNAYFVCSVSPGSVEADVGWGGKLNHHLMASCVRNISVKNRWNPLILFKVTIDNIGVPFLRDSVVVLFTSNHLAPTLSPRYLVKLECSTVQQRHALQICTKSLFEANIYNICYVIDRISIGLQTNLQYHSLCSNVRHQHCTHALSCTRHWTDQRMRRWQAVLCRRCRKISCRFDTKWR